MNITIKSLPDEMGAALKRAAEQSHRSLNGEILHRLRASMAQDARGSGFSPMLADSPDAVADAWAALAGKWKSDLSTEAEVASLYAARSAAREVDVTW